MHAPSIRKKEDGVILFPLKFHGSTLCYFLMKFLLTIFYVAREYDMAVLVTKLSPLNMLAHKRNKWPCICK